MTELDIIAEGLRYLRGLQVKIQTQRELIQGLESRGEDAATLRLEKEALAEMMKSLDLVLSRLRPVIDRAARA